MTDWKRSSNDPKANNPVLYTSPQTSQEIAELRAIYANQGRKFTSLAQVVKDAIFYYHQHMVELHGAPANAAEFTR